MIVSAYGIPRSGKDTFIKQVITKKSGNAFHLKGSETLNELSFKFFNCKFRQLDENKQKQIRIEFTKYAKKLEKKYELVIVDGHYSFPDGDNYKVVFTKADLELYDAFFYLKKSGEEIIRNFNSDDKKDYSEQLLSIEKSEAWMEFEIQDMQQVVENAEKDFIVLDSDSASIDFVCNYKKTAKEVALEVSKSIFAMTHGRKIVLSDLDKTVSINDLTNDFIEHSGLDSLFPKAIFKGDYYTSYQFYRFHMFLLGSLNYDESIHHSLNRLHLNKHVIHDLLKMKDSCCVIALTTGMVDAWSIKNSEMNLFENIYGFSKYNSIVITPLIKKLVAKYLSKNADVMAIGDSVIDLGMLLEANKGYIVSMTKLDKRIIKAYESGKIYKTLFQPPYSEFKYDFLKEEEIQW